VATNAAPIPRSNLKDSVAAHIRELIFSGKLPPGTKVDQDAIARELGVSKLPVREALISLETEALVRNLPRRGAYVAPLTADDVRDHYRIYGLLSAIAAERAAAALSEADLDRLEQLIGLMEADGITSDEQEQLNFEFHRLINRAGGSSRLNSALRLFAESIPHRFYEFTTGWSDLAAEHHRTILSALRQRDGREAGRAMADHLGAGGDYAVRLLTESGFFDSEEADGPPATAADVRE
jgi:DNA-binding GntR family transcriptional regulator